MAIDAKSPGTVGAGHGYGGMLIQVEEVYNAVKDRFGSTRFMGGYNNRNVRGGSTLSMHAFGRAFDIGGSPDVMQKIADYCRTINGVQYVIYNHKISGPGANKPWRAYTGVNPHTDHVHVDFLTSFKGFTGGSTSTSTYVVKAGDTLSAIAQKFNTTVAEIAKDNPQIKNLNLIHPGDKVYFF